MYPFEYHRPESLQEAVDLFESSDEAQWLAGGMTLLPTLKLRLAAPSALIDLAALDELQGLQRVNGGITVGAMTRHDAVARAAEVVDAIPALAVLAGGIGDSQVRNRGTIGGSISNSDPAADYPAAVLGLNATITTTRREIASDDFFTGLFETALESGEIVKQVSFPVPDRAGYIKFPNPASRYAVVGVMVSKTGSDVRVAVTGAGASAFRVEEMEQALMADFNPDALHGIEISASELNEDLHASAEYRAHLVNVMARRATALACDS
ncbi:MAG: FAD binding domain-containing protein [Candidatus Rariloculaceae bacterium]